MSAELAETLEQMLGAALTLPTHELEYADRMERRKDRRAEADYEKAKQWLAWADNHKITCDTPESILGPLRHAVRIIAMHDDPKYRAMIEALLAVAHPAPTQKRTRPSDGKPTGSAFDYDEYLTRKADRKAADPETYQREQAAKRRASREWWDRYKEKGEIDRANEDIASLGIKDRLHNIWAVIIDIEHSQKLDNIYLDQRARIANVKSRERFKGRFRGIGRAAKAAGY